MLSKINGFVLRVVARFRSEAGQALAEYGLILALIAVVCLIALGVLGVAVSGNLSRIATAMPLG
ncbi:MAG: Flp family type IVb pilin [Dehalococcoidia bacterium]|nr:Flp family type IVb pilin [Dehalococcoidia bacterium]